jgi:hypothetical protein
MRAFESFAALCIASLAGGVASAADVSRLEWGLFVPQSYSSGELQSWKTASTDDGSGLTVTFDSLIAKADGSTMEASANLSGHFDIDQPKSDPAAYYRVELRGHIIKSADSVARLVVTIGTEHKMLEWPKGSAASEPFVTTIESGVQPGGRLPDPFAISAAAYARKGDDGGAALVSLESISIATGNAKLAAK